MPAPNLDANGRLGFDEWMSLPEVKQIPRADKGAGRDEERGEREDEGENEFRREPPRGRRGG